MKSFALLCTAPLLAASLLVAPVPVNAEGAPTQADYDHDQKCLSVYLFMAVAERAMPPGNMQAYMDLAKADGHAIGKTDDQVKADLQAGAMAYVSAIRAQSTDDKVPDNAGWDDYKACNAYFAGRGLAPTMPATPQPKGPATSSQP